MTFKVAPLLTIPPFSVTLTPTCRQNVIATDIVPKNAVQSIRHMHRTAIKKEIVGVLMMKVDTLWVLYHVQVGNIPLLRVV
jgi:hypothetical protein